MVKLICSQCQNDNHKSCESMSCDCSCRIRGLVDTTQKALSVAVGLGMTAGGLFLTLGTGGLAIPFAGSLIGAGVSSVTQGIGKAIKGERIHGAGYCADVGFGALTGIITGGVGASCEIMAVSAAKEGAAKFALRATTNGLANVAAKVITEVKECAMNRKEWSKFGQMLDENGNFKATGTVAAWTGSLAAGGFGGAVSFLTSSMASAASSGITKFTTHVIASTTAGCTSDVIMQKINIAAGNQDKYDIKQTILSGTTSGITTVAIEAVENTIYAAHGGRDNFYADKTNLKLIRDNVPEEDQDNALRSYKNLKEVPNSVIKKSNNYYGKSKVHALQGDKINQIAADVNDIGATERGSRRMLFDVDPATSIPKFSDYTANHDYKNTNAYGQSGFSDMNDKLQAFDAAHNYEVNAIVSNAPRLSENAENDEDQEEKPKTD